MFAFCVCSCVFMCYGTPFVAFMCLLQSQNHPLSRIADLAAQLIIAAMRPAMVPKLRLFVATVSSYYHPSNSGHWMELLASLLWSLASHAVRACAAATDGGDDGGSGGGGGDMSGHYDDDGDFGDDDDDDDDDEDDDGGGGGGGGDGSEGAGDDGSAAGDVSSGRSGQLERSRGAAAIAGSGGATSSRCVRAKIGGSNGGSTGVSRRSAAERCARRWRAAERGIDVRGFVALLRPLAVNCIFAKDPGVRRAGEMALKHLATMCPEAVFDDDFMQRIDYALKTVTHAHQVRALRICGARYHLVTFITQFVIYSQ